ncbi:FKBP-type peptidyl-prolyl cis-trans isomerase [uncultured Polaribacter sp.]|uniref:FKBP-type peptidyl-prolyl cis-trans isomerase n=1 Tax=uncultured Polaribacter sp. TaxID=174711 RepID=UPI00259BF183|nr:FKBP-type peptidyl-prolyl cis-trans isomerase [uncultured Polaribacter sp.]
MKIIKIILTLTVVVSMASCGKQRKEVKSLNSKIDSVSYAAGMSYGVNINKQLKNGFEEVNKEIFIQGFLNGIDSLNFLMQEKDIQNVITTYFQKKQEAKMKEQQEKAIKEAEAKFGHIKKAGEEFLAANKSKKGIKTTASGLQYIVLKEGKGDLVKPTDKVKIHYHGTTIDGKVFDSSVEKKSPYTARANQFIPGFNEGLAMMKEGSKYKFFIPYKIAYGAQQRGELIKPLSTLIFEVEILEIIK